MTEMLRTENLTFHYPTEEGTPKRMVLKGVDITIKEGEFVAVLGHNGSGKSTFAKHLNGILLPVSGSVYALGMNTADEKMAMEIRRKIGMVFQNPDNQIIATVVDEDVAFALENLGVKHDEMVQRVDEALEMVGMTAYKNHAPHLLSGGQKQRVAIAGILAMRPRCIVMDEPTAMLDPSGRKEIMRTIKRLQKEGVTVVLITHYMDEAVQADRVIVMHDGKVLLDDTPKEVFQNVGLLKSVALDVPPSTALMFALRELDIKVPISVLTDEECVTVLSELMKGAYGDYTDRAFDA